jgi:hypothetical protein
VSARRPRCLKGGKAGVAKLAMAGAWQECSQGSDSSGVVLQEETERTENSEGIVLTTGKACNADLLWKTPFPLFPPVQNPSTLSFMIETAAELNCE